MADHPLTIEIRPGVDSVTLVLAGELDLCSGPTLRVCLEQLDPVFREVLVDLTDVSFLDSTGLNLLVGTHRHLAGLGGRLVVQGSCANVRRVLEVSGVDQVLTVQA